MTKDTAKNIGLVINLFIVFLFAFADDYLFKTLNLEYFKFEYQDSTIQATTYSVFNYQNKEMEIEVDWQRDDILEKGKYKILVFIEGKLVKEESFMLN